MGVSDELSGHVCSRGLLVFCGHCVCVHFIVVFLPWLSVNCVSAEMGVSNELSGHVFSLRCV